MLLIRSLLQDPFHHLQTCFQFLILGFKFLILRFELLIESLDRCQSNAAFVNGRNVFVIGADVKYG